MPEITTEQWAALRAEWEAGLGSNRQLAARYGVSEAALRKRATKEHWAKQATAAVEQVHDGATLRTLERLGEADAQQQAGGAQAGAQKQVRTSNTRVPPPLLNEEERGELSAEALERATEALAGFNIEHLDRLKRLQQTADRIQDLLDLYLSFPLEGDSDEVKAHRDRCQQAASLLMPGRTDGMPALMQALAKMRDSVQQQIRRMFGADDRARKVEVTGKGGGPVQLEGAPVIDLTAMTTEQLETVFSAVLVLEGQKPRPPIPMPPTGPLPQPEPEAEEVAP